MRILQKMFKEPLEREFTYYKFKHEYRILKNKMVEYFKAVEPEEVNLSGIYYQSPEQKAKDAIMDLIKTDVNKFHSLYEKAYSELI